MPPQNGTPTDPGVDPGAPASSVPADSGTPYNPPAATAGSTATGAPVTANSPPAAIAPGDSYQQDDLIGVFYVESTRPAVFDDADQALIEAVASQAAVAIQNAQYHQAERQHVAELEKVSS